METGSSSTLKPNTSILGEVTQLSRSVQFRDRFTKLLNQFNVPLEHEASSLLEDTCAWLNEPTSSGDVVVNAVLPQFSQLFGKVVGDLHASDEMQKAFLSLQSLVSIQEKEILQLKATNEDISTRLQKLEEERDAEKALLKSYDLADLFVFYYVYPIITNPPYNCTSWNDFTTQMVKWEDDVAESKVTVGAFRQWLHPLESHVKVDILTLRSMMSSRHAVAHTDLRSAQNQQQFVQSLSSYVAPPTYKAIFDTLTKKMQSHSAWKRKVY